MFDEVIGKSVNQAILGGMRRFFVRLKAQRNRSPRSLRRFEFRDGRNGNRVDVQRDGVIGGMRRLVDLSGSALREKFLPLRPFHKNFRLNQRLPKILRWVG
ncbi:hypothetical protein KOR42_02150 [Thalassoglobus neptunius]|uniref:Uncharacterized protein n=1 Tax=Thalassoglobus neptunius TaxID=1938619 RepID=A0A5C5X208_9PLAN|nr:hypothetical protein KOR42_02150 [Thalassoglobus neptunius]